MYIITTVTTTTLFYSSFLFLCVLMISAFWEQLHKEQLPLCKQLQMQPIQHGEIIKHMAKLLDSITVSTSEELFAFQYQLNWILFNKLWFC